MSTEIVEKLQSHFGVLTTLETFARSFVGGHRAKKLSLEESNIIEKDHDSYKRAKALPVYVLNAFQALQ